MTSHDPHEIRLRGPWEATFQPEVGVAEPPRTVTMPVSWRELFGDRSGRACFTRRFNRPTNLDAWERVLLVITDLPGEVDVALNGAALSAPTDPAAPGRRRYDLTAHLREANRVEIAAAWNPASDATSPGGLHRPVVLEIA